MPRLTVPPDMPEEVAAVIEIIGNRARARIIRELGLRGPQSAPELAETIGARREVVFQHLLQLEGAGLVDADEPQGRRHGRTVRWTVREDQLTRVVERLGNYLAGK